MPATPSSFLIFAQQAEVVLKEVQVTEVPRWFETWYGMLAILVAIVVFSVVVSQAIAGWVRMKAESACWNVP